VHKHTSAVALFAIIAVILSFTVSIIAPLVLLPPVVTIINTFSVVIGVVMLIAWWWGVQGRTQGQLDKAEGEPNHWTFLTGNTVATLPMTRFIALAASLRDCPRCFIT